MEIKLQEQQANSQKGEQPSPDIVKEAAQLELKNRIEADGKFLEEVGKASDSADGENTEESSRETDRTSGEGKDSRDTAALSEEGRYYKLTPEELADLDKMWGKEEAEAAWKEILSWNPYGAASLQDLLSGLEGIYKDLLTAILSNTTGVVKEQQLALLDQVLSELLLKVLGGRVGELNSLFESFGNSNSSGALKGALYKGATGISLPPGELEKVFQKQSVSKGTEPVIKGEGVSKAAAEEDISLGGVVSPVKETAEGKKESGAGPLKGPAAGPAKSIASPTGNIRVPVSDGDGGLEQGVIYQKTGKGQIKSNQQYARRMQSEAGISVYGRAGKKSVYSPKALNGVPQQALQGKNAVYTFRDLERAEGFAKYMNHEGNLFKAPGITGKNEELYGFLAALMSIKSQTFATCSGVEGRLVSDLRDAVDRMIDYYMQKALEHSKASTGRPNHRPFEPKAAYKTYYYIMNLYQTTRNLQETVNKGIRQAYKQFLKKKECSKEDFPESFFTKEKKDPVSDWKEGKRLLERDWREFLSFLGREDLGNLPLGVMELSPWGMFLESEGPSHKEKGSTPPFLLGTALLVVIVLLFLLFMP